MTWFHAKDLPAGLDRQVQNRSLYVSKYANVPDNKDDKVARRSSLDHLVTLRGDSHLSGLARESRAVWRPADAVEFRLTLAARLVVDHAGGVLENAGLALHRLTGEPYIPGSALKGIARAAAQAADATEAERSLVFGYEAASCPNLKANDWPAFAGAVAFLPAFPVGNAALELDVVTCHHPEYYAGRRPKALDDEQPIPNPFPVVKPDVEFRFVLAPVGLARVKAMMTALGMPSPFDPLAKAKEWLIAGLTERGVGAKTAAGYGSFALPGADAPGAAPAAQAPVPDYTEVLFANTVRRRYASRGEWGDLRKEVEKLKKPENAKWLELFKKETATDKAYKNLRAQEWYPR